GSATASFQLEHQQYHPKPGWVEHDPVEIWERTVRVIQETLKHVGYRRGSLKAIGVTNQRETTVVWDPVTGKPYMNAIVWQDTRTAPMIEALRSTHGKDHFRNRTGLPLATYFSGPKIRWILDNVPGVRDAACKGRALFGTIDSWIVWNLTGGPHGGVHLTDVTNASRTMLMNLETLSWDGRMIETFEIPEPMLPVIRPSVSAEPYGYTCKDGPFAERIPVCGILGDQQAALFGHGCFSAGSSKNTYGTGCFLLMNTGQKLVQSNYGLVSTVAYQKSGEEPVYALEGSIAVAGALVQWLRDNIGLIERSSEIENLASSAEDNGGVYFVPAFSGLYAPHWRTDARGVIAGLTAFAGAPHLARAVLESTAFQVKEIVDAMEKDFGSKIDTLKVDGGMVANELLMQFQADILNVPVIRPKVSEITVLGAAYAAGLSVGFWKSEDELVGQWAEDKRWTPVMGNAERNERVGFWNKAVERSLGWV
ncbi:MAG: glycerol kinase GlpK, partial [Spirochaetales bacterium]|nr:glycerol kinase GlpK [Spirochaetales bacterium]